MATYWTLFISTIYSTVFLPSSNSSILQSNAFDWAKIEVETMKYSDLMDYFRWANSLTCKLRKDFGANKDGKKHVCLDPQIGLEPGNCLVYSFGVNHDWTFDEQLANYGCQVYAFDPMVQKPYNRSNAIHVYNFGLSFATGTSVQNWTIFPLKTIYKSLKPIHGRIPISLLKFDMEDFDLRVLPNIMRTGMLRYIQQLSLEVHVEPEVTLDNLRDLAEILQALEETGMERFASNEIPSSRDWFEPLESEECLDFDISWYNKNFTLEN